jgi:hypothetical protein
LLFEIFYPGIFVDQEELRTGYFGKVPQVPGDYSKAKAGVVRHDAYFEIVDKERQMKGEAHRGRFLLELDWSTHDNPGFGRGKIVPSVAYIKSSAYKSRFGSNNGRWLIVTNGGQTRMRNLMLQTKEYAGQDTGWFFFASIKDVENGHLLTSPIWRQIGREEPRALLN